MSWRARERKRKERAARNRDRMASRRTASNGTYWLTPVRPKTCCAKCRDILNIDAEMVYCSSPRESLCVACATEARIFYRPSLRWERARS